MGYLEIQGTKPLTVSYGLVDSPIGMLAWIRDKVQHLVGDNFVWEEEEIITWTMVCFQSRSLRPLRPSLINHSCTLSMEPQVMPVYTGMPKQRDLNHSMQIS
jgi:hypothetical protein